MNDDRLRHILETAEEPLAPSPEYGTSLLDQLRVELRFEGAATAPVHPAPGTRAGARRRRIRPIHLLVAAALLVPATVGALAAAGAFRGDRDRLPPLGDVPMYRVDLLGRLEMPGPGPTGPPVEVWRTGRGTSFSPVLADGTIVGAESAAGRFVAIDPRSGLERWALDTPASGPSFTGAAAIDGGTAFIADPAELHTIDLTSGRENWSAPAPNTGARPKVLDGVVYLATTDGARGFDVATGRQVWSWAGPEGGATLIGPIADGIAYLAGADGRLHAIGIDDPRERWSVQTISSAVGSAELAGDTVFVVTNQATAPDPVGELYAIDRATGAIRWRFRGPSGAQLNAGPVRNGVIYVNSQADGMYALRDDGSAASQVWHVDSPQSYFPLSIAGDTLYEQRFDGSLGAYDRTDGRLRWETPPLGANGTGPPIVSGGMVIAGNEVAGLIAYADADLVARLDVPRPSTTAQSTPTSASPSASLMPAAFSVVRSIPLAATGIRNPLGMAAGPDGLLYVLDTKPSVVVFDPADGRVVHTWGRQGSGPGEFDLTRFDDNPGNGDIAVAPNGRVYVADGSNRRVQIFERDGTFVTVFGEAGPADDQFGQIAKIVIARDGSVYTQDAKDASISKFTPDGVFLWRGPEPESDPDIHMPPVFPAVRTDGVLVATAEQSGRAVLIDPADGRITRTIPLPEVVGDGFGILELDPHDNLWIQVYASSPDSPLQAAILAFAPDGAFLGGNYRPPSLAPPTESKIISYGDWFFPTPVFLPDGRAFTFSADGLTEVRAEVP